MQARCLRSQLFSFQYFDFSEFVSFLSVISLMREGDLRRPVAQANGNVEVTIARLRGTGETARSVDE